jgi:predicted O-methyltransferase YrrM
MNSFSELCQQLGLPPDLPYDPVWSAGADFLARIVEHTLATRPRTIVECSSGTSTLLLARCCALNGGGQVLSLEHGAEFAAATRREVNRLGLVQRVTVLDAPLAPIRIDGRDFMWYDLTQLPTCHIDLLVVDGPPGFVQPLSRYPAFPLLRSRMTSGAVIYLDDAARPDEREIVRKWLGEEPSLLHEYLEFERGCSILRRQP